MSHNVNPLGVKLFLVYLAVYGGFVGLNAFWPDVMRRPAFVGAFVLAVIYAVARGDGRQDE